MDANETSADSMLPIGPTARDKAAALEPFALSGFAQALALGDMQVLADDLPSALQTYEKALGVLGNDPAWKRKRAEARFRIAECHRRRGEFREAIGILDRIREEVLPESEPDLNAKVIGRISIVQQTLGEYAAARANSLAAYGILRGTNDNEEIGLLELNLGTIALRLGEIDRAREFYESALFTFRRIDHREGIARALNNLGLLLTPTPRWEEALDYLQRALAVSEEAGNSPRIASHCLNLGVLLTKCCEWTRALQTLSRALLIFRENDNSTGITRSLLALGNLKRRLGQQKIAAAQYVQALDLARSRGYRREEVLALEFLGEMALREGRFEEARSSLSEALQKAKAVAPEGDLVSEVVRRLAEEAFLRGDHVGATRMATDAAWISERISDRCEMGSCLRILGLAAWETGRPDAAIRHLTRSVEVLSVTPDILEETLSRIHLAKILNEAASQQVVFSFAQRVGRAPQSTIETLEPVWERITGLDLTWLIAEYVDAHARALVSEGDLEGALRIIDRALPILEKQELSEDRSRLIDLRIQLAENQAECVLGTTEEFRILQEFTPGGGSDMNGTGGLNKLLEQMANHLQILRALVAIGPSFKETHVEASYGLDRPAAMLRAFDPVLQAFASGRVVWLSGNGAQALRLVEPKGRWHQDGPLVALRLRPGEDLWGVLAAERAPGSEPFGTRDLRLLSLFGSLISVAIEARKNARLEFDEGERIDAERDPFGKFQTVDSTLKQTLSMLRRVTDSDVNILITGETGTGKGLLAEGIHRASRRRDKALIQVNCAALPEQLLESELFGHVQGAFTGAVRNKRGLIEEADGGTLFLDEVDRCHRNVQAKLLHVLDRREFRAVGDVRSRTVDVRIICATNRDLSAAIAEGTFLEDLFYRLNDFQFSIPALRERPDDIPILVRHFLSRFTKEMDRRPAGITREALRRLMDHEWRGNVRELEKCMRRLVVLCEDGEWIGVDLLPPELQVIGLEGRGQHTLRDAVRRLEADLIRRTLDETRGNKSETSRRLHLSYPALLQKIRLYHLESVSNHKKHSKTS